MDRFIDNHIIYLVKYQRNLKSNMDRFIDSTFIIFYYVDFDLKSNMDRFIGYRALKGHFCVGI